MFDTMTLTKIVGGFCGALLVFLMGNWAGETIYSMGGGHGDHHEQGYVIDTGDDGEEEVVEETGPSFEELFVSADAGKGERVFNKCKACHKIEDGANATGPHLYGVVGRDVGAADGFGYSGSLKAVADVWTPQELDAFLENPSGYAPGTSMGFSGLGDAEDRANVIAYLDETDGDTYVLEVSDGDTVEAEEVMDEATDEGATEDAMGEDEASAGQEGADTEMAATGDTGGEMSEAETAGDATTGDTSAEDVAATEEEAAQADTGEAEDAGAQTAESEAAAEEEPADAAGGTSEFAQMVASADPDAGQKLYRGCQACHKLEDGANGVGPHLYDVVGRPVASVEGYRYSGALEELGGDWTVDRMSAWLEDPRGFAPGNKMGYPGLRDEGDRADLIAYLQTTGE